MACACVEMHIKGASLGDITFDKFVITVAQKYRLNYVLRKLEAIHSVEIMSRQLAIGMWSKRAGIRDLTKVT